MLRQSMFVLSPRHTGPNTGPAEPSVAQVNLPVFRTIIDGVDHLHRDVIQVTRMDLGSHCWRLALCSKALSFAYESPTASVVDSRDPPMWNRLWKI